MNEITMKELERKILGEAEKVPGLYDLVREAYIEAFREGRYAGLKDWNADAEKEWHVSKARTKLDELQRAAD